MSYIRLPAVLAAICAMLPAVAHGQAGQRPDPDSPAGVEYQLPLEQARKNAAGGAADQRERGGTAAVPLFGAGILAHKDDDERGDSSDAEGGQGEDGSGEGSGASGAGGGDSSGAGDPTVRQSALGAAGSDDGSPTLQIAGIALAVLLVGGLLGLALRRGLRQTGD